MRHADAQYVLDTSHVLGVIPRDDLLGLVKHAVVMLNPSKFEGGNTSIEEAKALGVRVIASDIAVHREQVSPNALYFDSDRPDQLASAMANVWAERDQSSAIVITPFVATGEAFARAYEEIVLELLAERARPRTAGLVASED